MLGYNSVRLNFSRLGVPCRGRRLLTPVSNELLFSEALSPSIINTYRTESVVPAILLDEGSWSVRKSSNPL